jgi:hypothetical protein
MARRLLGSGAYAIVLLPEYYVHVRGGTALRPWEEGATLWHRCTT